MFKIEQKKIIVDITTSNRTVSSVWNRLKHACVRWLRHKTDYTKVHDTYMPTKRRLRQISTKQLNLNSSDWLTTTSRGGSILFSLHRHVATTSLPRRKRSAEIVERGGSSCSRLDAAAADPAASDACPYARKSVQIDAWNPPAFFFARPAPPPRGPIVCTAVTHGLTYHRS